MPSDPVDLIVDHSYGTWREQSQWKKPLFVTRAEGSYFYDRSEKKYLDFSSQLMCSNLGHGNKAIIDAICKQAQELPYIAPSFVCEAKARAVSSLLEIMPKGIGQFFFSTSGTEANEDALKIIRQYTEPQGKFKIISRYRSYHGATAAGISLTGDPRRWYAERARMTIGGVVFAPDAYCYRCPFNMKYPECGIECARYVDYMIKEEGNVAAMWIEPVVGTNGRIVPPKEYLPMVREICNENNVLLVADEVMSGWYRTGTWWAVNNWNIKPDVLTTAKGATGAYVPLGITATNEEIRNYFEGNVLSHGHTYYMHPLALGVVPAVIKEYKKVVQSGLPKRLSSFMEKELKSLQEKHVSIGDVRGIGHFWAIELVKNRETKKPFNVKADKFTDKILMTDRVANEAMKRGVYIDRWYDTLCIAPPLIIKEEEAEEGFNVLDEVLKIADSETEK
jgi:taurine--2-oxoglutarate transaminase